MITIIIIDVDSMVLAIIIITISIVIIEKSKISSTIVFENNHAFTAWELSNKIMKIISKNKKKMFFLGGITFLLKMLWIKCLI